MVQESLAGGQQYVVYVGLDLLGEGSVATDTQFQVRTVVANHIHLSGRQFVAILFVHPALYGLYDLRIKETVDMIVASGIPTV